MTSLMNEIDDSSIKYIKKTLNDINYNYIDIQKLFKIQKYILFINDDENAISNNTLIYKTTKIKKSRTLKKHELSHETLFKITKKLKVFHKLKVQANKWKPWTFESLYYFFINNIKTKNTFLDYSFLLKINPSEKSKIVITHNDLHLNNLLINDINDIFIIDWDFCNYNDFHYDIASFIAENNLTKTQSNTFIDCYEKNIFKCSRRLIIDFIKLNNLLNAMWALYLYENTKNNAFLNIYKEKQKYLKNIIKK